MTTTLFPQFDTNILNLELKKGESAQFAVTVSNYDLDLRGCLIFSEIRRTSPGYTLVNGFTGIVASGSSTITLKKYPSTDDKSAILDILPIRVNDLITLEGSGITASKVVAVTDSQIIASTTATRPISEGRLLIRSLSLASFTAVPYSPVFSVILQGSVSVGATQITVSGLINSIPSGTVLAFVDSGVVKLATTTVVANIGDTVINVASLAIAIGNGAIARIGAQAIIVSASASASATSISVSSLNVPIPLGTVLNFATRTTDGWQYTGSATLSASALSGATSISVNALSQGMGAGAIAWFGTVPFKSFYLAVDPTDTYLLESGDYGYDVICRQPNGYTIRLIQGNCKLKDHWSDGV